MSSVVDSLDRAFDRIDDFQAVQGGRRGEELLDAVCLLQESVGITEEIRAALAARLHAIDGSSRAPGHVLLGLIVGLMAAQLGDEALHSGA